MEMTLTVHLPRRRPHPVDVVVQWWHPATAAELCTALTDLLGEPVRGLASRGRTLPPQAAVGWPPLVHGASVVVVAGAWAAPVAGGARAPTSGGTGPLPRGSGVLDLVVVGGPDAGRSLPLTPPGVVVGRAASGGLSLADDALSREHLMVHVASSGVSVEDLGSTNGVWVDGARVTDVRTVNARSTVVVGSSTLRLRRAVGVGPPVTSPGDGTLHVRPAPPPNPDAGDVEIACPPAPPERHRPRIPWLAAVAPVPVALALAAFLGPQLLLFALLGPVSMLAGTVGERFGWGREHRRALAAHGVALERARARLSEALRSEVERLDRAHPDPAGVLATAEHHRAGLWRGGGSMVVRLGLGTVPTRVSWVEEGERRRPAAPCAPVLLDLSDAGICGVVGTSAATSRFLAGLVGQLCTALPPHELRVSVRLPDPSWGWVERLPHAAAADRAARHLLVVVPAGVDGGARSAQEARSRGAVVLVAAADTADLPPGCGAVVDLREEAGVLEGASGPAPFVPDLVWPWWSDRLSRALAPLRCPEPAGLPQVATRVALLDALGGVELTPHAVLDRWGVAVAPAARLATEAGAPGASTPDESASTAGPDPASAAAAHGASGLRVAPPRAGPGRAAAVVGTTSSGPFVIDLDRDGPHVLVGGTTGSGKSEFLRTLVTSLALSAPPHELVLVLVDFKGGAAFAQCARLPHVVGLVTDLDDHLVWRALASLRAELRRRERLFAAVGASDLAAYQRLAPPGAEPVPRLVVVVDELRALVEELPEFVTGLVRLAALGRSLGVHLVLATQRPAGALGADIQANVSLRIAFRVRDRADSHDVLDDPAAAGISSTTPGRGFARGGDGRLVEFQAATVSATGHPTSHGGPLWVRLAGAANAEPPAAQPADALPAVSAALPGPALEEVVRAAHRLAALPTPRPPWLPPLPAVIAPVLEGGRGWLLPGAASPGGLPAAGVTAPPAPVLVEDEAVSVGLVDEPDLQRVSPLSWHPGDGPWLLAGPSGCGRTTALRALVLGAAARLGPEQLHVHVVDATGALADLAALPHVGTRATPDDTRTCSALLAHLRAEVDRRLLHPASRALGGAHEAPEPTLLLVVDGWDHVIEAQLPGPHHDMPTELVRVLRDGRSVGVLGAVSGGRSLLHPRWNGIGGLGFLLGHVDPLDAALAGLRRTDVPHDPPPGRAVRMHDRREVQFVAASPQHTAVLAGASTQPSAGRSAWRWRALPTIVRRADLDVPTARAGARAEVDGRGDDEEVVLGLVAGSLARCCWRPGRDGRRLLVAGPPGSGRTAALLTIAQSLAASGRTVALVTDAGGWATVRCSSRRAAPRVTSGSGGFGHASDMTGVSGQVWTLRSDEVEQLAALRTACPDLAVLVDDVDRLVDAPAARVVQELAARLDRSGGLLVAATSSPSLPMRFRGLDVELARHRLLLLLNPTSADRDLLGGTVPDGIPRVPGRGLFSRRGQVSEVQVVAPAPVPDTAPEPADVACAPSPDVPPGPSSSDVAPRPSWADVAPGPSSPGVAPGPSLPDVAPGKNLRLGVPRDPGGNHGHHGHDDDDPPDERALPLDEADPHRQQDHVPHDGRRPRPGGRAQPTADQHRESEAADEDQQGRHEHPGGVAALPQHELHHVEDGETDEGQGLQPGDQRGEATGATG